MRILIPLFFFLVLLAPVPALAADATFFGPLIPPQCNCDQGEVRTAADFGCVLATVQNTTNLIISLSIILAMFYMVLIGFQFITSAGNPSAREVARKRVMNLVFGFLLLLGAWLIVDFIMKTLYKPDASAGAVTLGPWNSILGSAEGKMCLEVAPPPPPLPSVVSTQTPPSTGTGTGTGGNTGTGSNCPAADPSTMVAFPASAVSGDPESASAETVRNFLAMREAALRDNIDLKVVDGYRPESEQIDLWNQRDEIGLVGRPCSLGGTGSNHNRGVALDIDVDCRKSDSNCNSAKFNWLKANGGRWNFRNNLPNDVVHWSPSGR